MKTAVQQIMLGTVCKSEEETLKTLLKIKEAGYDGIELNRFMIQPTSWLVRMMTKAAGMPVGKGGKFDWQALVKKSGLIILSLHTDLGSLERETEKVIQEAKAFGTSFIVITGMYRFNYSDADSVRSLGRRLNDAGKVIKEKGLQLLYHNHNVELLKVCEKDGSPVLDEQGNALCAYDLLIRETDPAFVNFELDTFWFAEGGADVLGIMKKLGGRMKLWHVTDRGNRLKAAAMTPILKSDSVELGTGNMDLDGLWDMAEQNAVQGIILESHRNWIDKDPIKSLTISGKYLQKKIGVSHASDQPEM